LDKILEINLKQSNNYKIDAKKLAENINPLDFESLFSESFSEKVKSWFVKPKSLAEMDFEFPVEFNSDESKFINALWHLHSEGLLHFTPFPVNTSLLTFKGILKISSGGFYNEYKRQKRRNIFQNYFWLVAILTFIFGWFLKPLADIIITKYF
jgi:hypothetical protein